MSIYLNPIKYSFSLLSCRHNKSNCYLFIKRFFGNQYNILSEYKKY